jgi:hypothetical protein
MTIFDQYFEALSFSLNNLVEDLDRRGVAGVF